MKVVDNIKKLVGEKKETSGSNKKTKKIRFALVGCGRISRKHVTSIDELPDAELVAVCDIIEEKAKAIGEKLDIPYYVSYDDMLKREDVDVVNILTPSCDHAKHTIDIVKKFQKDVVVEKPMALKLADADEMIKVCDENNTRLFVVKQNRYNVAVQKLRNAIDEGRMGKLVLGTARVRWSRDQNYYDQAEWRGTWWGDGGVMTNQASHHIDLLEWMMGDVESVTCMTATQLVDIETEDTAVATLKFSNGALGVVEVTTATRPTDLEGSISVLGEKGSVVVGGFAVNKIDTWNFVEPVEGDEKVVDEFKELPPNVYGFGHTAYLRNVINCIKGDTKALVDGFEGRKSLELINALYEAAETGQTVHLRFHPSKCRLGEKRK